MSKIQSDKMYLGKQRSQTNATKVISCCCAVEIKVLTEHQLHSSWHRAFFFCNQSPKFLMVFLVQLIASHRIAKKSQRKGTDLKVCQYLLFDWNHKTTNKTLIYLPLSPISNSGHNMNQQIFLFVSDKKKLYFLRIFERIGKK